MLPRNHPDRIQIAFDDPRLVANAGLLLPVTLAQHLGLREVVDSHVDLGDAPGWANPGDKLLTLVASALAGGDFIDDADVLRTGGTAGAIGCVSLVTIHAALTLLEVYWIGGKVPVDHRMAPPVEVDSLLADGGGSENERPEWRVESRPDLGQSSFILAVAHAAESQRVPARESDSLAVEVIDVGSSVNRLPEGYRPPCGRGKRD